MHTHEGENKLAAGTGAGGDPLAERRLFLRDLDSVTQHRFVVGEPEEWTALSVRPGFSAAVRLAMLLGQRVVVTNSQLFDGRAFLAWGPSGFGELVGGTRDIVSRGLPLTVLARHDDLSQALVNLVRPDDGGPHLKAFKFSVLSESDAQAVMTKLEGMEVAAFDARVLANGPAHALGETLQDCGLTPARCEALVERWQAWIDAESLVTVSSGWAGRPELTRLSKVELDRFDAVAGADTSARAWVQEYADPESGIGSRSDAYDVLDSKVEMDRTTREELRSLVDDRYNMSIARQRKCDYIEIGLTGTDDERKLDLRSTEYSRRDDRDATNHIRLEGKGLSGLAEMPPNVFSRLRYQTRDASAEWWSQKRRSAARAQRTIAYAIRLATEQPRPSRLVRQAVLTLVVVFLLAFLPALLSSTSSWWLLGIAGGLLALGASVPEFVTLWSLRSRSLRKDLDATEFDIT